MNDYHLKQLSDIIKRPELQISRYVEQGGVKHIKKYVVQALKNEFENK